LSSTPHSNPLPSPQERTLAKVPIQAVAKIAATWTAKGWNTAQSTKNTYRLLEEILEYLKTRGEYADISTVPIEEIALMAIGLSDARSSSKEASSEACPTEYIEEVCELLLFAAFTTHSLNEGEGWEHGIHTRIDWLDYVLEQKDYAHKAELPDHLNQRESDGTLKRVPFVAGLRELMPKKKNIKAHQRKPRFRRWLIEESRRMFFEPDNPYAPRITPKIKSNSLGEIQLQDLTAEKAHRLIAKWVKEGIPGDIYQEAWRTFDRWWIGGRSRTNSQNRKVGLEKKELANEKLRIETAPTPANPKAVKKKSARTVKARRAAPKKKKITRKPQPQKNRKSKGSALSA
jgi:hypothetical protein